MNHLGPNCFPGDNFISNADRLMVDSNQNPVLFRKGFQVLLILEGNGLLFISNNVVSFKQGDLFFFGKKLRCKLKYSEIFYSKRIGSHPKTMSLFFDKGKLKKSLRHIPEAYRINKLIDFSEYGVKVSQLEEAYLTRQVEKIQNAVGLNRFLLLLKFMDFISRGKNVAILSAKTTLKYMGDENEPKLGKICNFIRKNHKETITLERISGIANMSPTGFCRFFKSKTKKTFSQYLAEIRVESARGLLRDTALTVLDCCYACGYTNISNFHNQFKKYTGMSPSEYRLNIKNNGVLIS